MTALKGKHHPFDGIGSRRPRRGRGVFGRTRASSGGVGAALPAARRCAVLPILDLHRARLMPLQWGKKKKKIKKSTNSNFGFHIGYSVCQPNELRSAHWPISR
jgi:hypothetical protein